MLAVSEKQDLINKVRILKKDLSDIRFKIKEISPIKEAEFQKKEILKKEIKSLIKNLKEIKVTKDNSFSSVKHLKDQRDKYNSEVKNLIKNIKELNSEKEKAFKRYNVKTDPSVIQNKIEEIEKRLETEVSFESEKKLMKEINGLKKIYHESSEIRSLLDNINNLSRGIRASKEKADSFHEQIKEHSKQTKSGYTDFIGLSRKINDLRKKEEETFNKFIEFKKQIVALNISFNAKLSELNALEEHLNEDSREKKQKTQESEKATLFEKATSVFEKLKIKKKLTTEDLLVFQGKK